MLRRWVATTGLLIVASAVFIGCGSMNKPQNTKYPVFKELSAEDSALLDQQRAVVASAARKRYGIAELSHKEDDLPTLQRLINDHVFEKTQTYELQCLGVAFGDVLSSRYPLKWAMVTDEYGTDPTLRYKMTTIQLNALTMISKRIERGEPVDVEHLFKQTEQELARFEKQLSEE